MASARVLLIDRSVLSANIFRLLFFPFDARLVVAERFEEGRPHFFRRPGIDLAIINSNVFGKQFHHLLDALCDDAEVKAVPKIFLCRDGDAEASWRDVLVNVPKSRVVVRPFHPDAFTTLIKETLSFGKERI